MKKLIFKSILLVTSLLVFTPLALSHGSLEPEHGGIVKEKHDLVFELVREESTISLYLRDHGKPVNAESIEGSVTILASGKKQVVKLNYASENKMVAETTIDDGAKLLVKVKMEDHHTITVRYAF